MPDRARLAVLARRLESGETGLPLSADIARAVGIAVVDRGKVLGVQWRPSGSGEWDYLPDLTASLDAAVALVERVLPGCSITLSFGARTAGAVIRTRVGSSFGADAATPAAALVLALVRAEIAREGDR